MNRLTIPMLRPGAEPILAGRLSGKRAFLSALEQLPEMAEPTLVLLDFRDVALATSSYLSEAVLTLRDHLRLRRHPGYVVSANLSDNVREEIEEMLRRSGDALITCAIDDKRAHPRCAALRQARQQASGNSRASQSQGRNHSRRTPRGIAARGRSRCDSVEQPSDLLSGEKLDRGNLARPHEEVPAGTGDGLMGLDFSPQSRAGFYPRARPPRRRAPHAQPLQSRPAGRCPYRVCRNLRGREGHSRRKGSSPYHKGQGDRAARQRPDRGMPESSGWSLSKHLQAGAGIAQGEIKSLQPISQTVEIGICD